MTLLLISFVAGLLTVLAPCVLPLLPVIVGGSITGEPNPKRALVTIISLAISVFVFTFVLKVSTAFIKVPPEFWAIVSGALLIVFGIITIFPTLWDRLGFVNYLNRRSSTVMNAGFKKKSFAGDILIGAALGPVFSSCSPTYFLILATILPVSLAKGILFLAVYIIGLSLSLLAIALIGQRLVGRLDGISNPNGWFKRGLGILFLLIGILVIFGIDKKIEAGILAHAGVLDITKVEQYLLTKDKGSGLSTTVDEHLTPEEKAARYKVAPELVAPDAYLNTGGKPITLSQYKGKNVVLVDFWTYSCINCQRTLPYLTTWYKKYGDEGLVVIGVHTPEFAFEHEESNVQKALTQFGITYPVVLDNEYKTWDAFGNNFWPQEYLIDIDGYIVHDHAGEGEYDVTEAAIQAALRERAARLGLQETIASTTTSIAPADLNGVGSPETYFGSSRNVLLANGKPNTAGVQTLTTSSSIDANKLYLGGRWDFSPQYATAGEGDTITYKYSSKEVYIVASSDQGGTIEVLQDGKPIGTAKGVDVGNSGMVTVGQSRLYKLVFNAEPGEHTLTLKAHGASIRFYTFTFG